MNLPFTLTITFVDYCLFDSSTSRNMLQSYEMFYKDEKGQRIPNQYKFHALITTYEVIISDCELLSDIEWRVLIIDEAHRLKNAKCKLMEGLRMFDCVSWLKFVYLHGCNLLGYKLGNTSLMMTKCTYIYMLVFYKKWRRVVMQFDYTFFFIIIIFQKKSTINAIVCPCLAKLDTKFLIWLFCTRLINFASKFSLL